MKLVNILEGIIVSQMGKDKDATIENLKKL